MGEKRVAEVGSDDDWEPVREEEGIGIAREGRR